MERLRHWIDDMNGTQDQIRLDCAFVEQKEFEKQRPRSFKELLKLASCEMANQGNFS